MNFLRYKILIFQKSLSQTCIFWSMPEKWSLLFFLFRIFLPKSISLNTLWDIQNIIFRVSIGDVDFLVYISTYVSRRSFRCFYFIYWTTCSPVYLDGVIGWDICFFQVRAAVFYGNHVLMVWSCAIFSSVLFSCWTFSGLIFAESGCFFFFNRMRIRFKIVQSKKFLEFRFPKQKGVLLNHLSFLFIFYSYLFILIKVRFPH